MGLMAKVVRNGVGVVALVAAMGAGGAFGQSIPEKTVTRDLVRRLLVDACVYSTHARAAQAGEKTEKKDFVEACQCGASRFIKGVADPDIAALQGQSQLPDAWGRAVETGAVECKR